MTIQFGKFHVHELVGATVVATEHRAELLDVTGMPIQVALRRLMPAMATDETIVRAFVLEAQLGLFLQSPNVARTFELGTIDGVLFVAVELLHGRSLAELLADAMRTRQPIPLPIAIAILCQICDALVYAHGLCDPSGRPLGIVHGDLTPANIIVTGDGPVKLEAFGRMEPLALTAPNPRLGYLAPEVANGMRDGRADLFMLGVIAHEMLANQPLFVTGDDRETVGRLHTLAIPPPSATNPQVPPEIDGIVLAALARDPAYRWQYATHLRHSLYEVAQHYRLEVAPPQLGAWLLAQAAGPLLPPAVPTVSPAPPNDPDPPSPVKLRAPTPRNPAPPLAEPAARPTLPQDFDPELGPEPTQIGAMPLIAFGEDHEAGRPKPRGKLPEATGISLDNTDEPRKRSRIPLILAAVGVAAIVVVVLALVL